MKHYGDGRMTVKELRELLASGLPGMADDAQVVSWDSTKRAWQPLDYDMSSVSGASPWTSLLLGTASQFAEARGQGKADAAG